MGGAVRLRKFWILIWTSRVLMGAGGDPGGERFNPEAQLDAVSELAALGVTWSGISVPGDSLDHALETLQRFGDSVIRPH